MGMHQIISIWKKEELNNSLYDDDQAKLSRNQT